METTKRRKQLLKITILIAIICIITILIIMQNTNILKRITQEENKQETEETKITYEITTNEASELYIFLKIENKERNRKSNSI